MTQFPDLFESLAAQFDSQEVRAKTQNGKQLHYITARTAMNRLDTVLGGENWWDEYVPAEHSVLCRLTIRLPDGSTITKCDAGGYAGMPDSGDDEKSGFSDAFKRAAVKFGVGRYLYRDGVPAFRLAPSDPPTTFPVPEPVAVDAKSRPVPTTPATSSVAPEPVKPPSAPRSGRALFAWTKEMEQKYEVGLLKYLNSFMKLQEFPGRMVDLDADQVMICYEEATRKLRSISTLKSEAYEEALAR